MIKVYTVKHDPDRLRLDQVLNRRLREEDINAADIINITPADTDTANFKFTLWHIFVRG